MRIKKAEADRVEREELVARGDLVSRPDYELFAIEVIQGARDELLRLPNECRRHLCKKCQPKVSEIRTLIEKALNNLAKLPKGPEKE